MLDLYNFVLFVLIPRMEVVVALVLVWNFFLKQSSLPDHSFIVDVWLHDINLCDYN